MKHPLVKLLTLISFMGLITLFVAQRAGYWSLQSPLQLSPNGGALQTGAADSIPVRDSTDSQPLVIPSSKTIILTQPDLGKLIREGDSASEPSPVIFNGSKSGPVVTPTNKQIRQEKRRKRKALKKKSPTIIPGSKSAPVWLPTVVDSVAADSSDSNP